MKKTILIVLAVLLGLSAIVGLTLGGIWLYSRNAHYDFDHTVPPAEAIARSQMVSAAEKWLGSNEADGSHHAIVDLYNSHSPLAQGYKVTYEDNWCATFVSAVAIDLGFTHIIPTECGCQRQIGLFQELGCWVEDDAYVPLPGDIIYYSIEHAPAKGDCTTWSDHVGIVVGTAGKFMKVIEGNYGDRVTYRYLFIDDQQIRGYAVPNYGDAA